MPLPPRRRVVSTSVTASLVSLAALASLTALAGPVPAATGAESPDGRPAPSSPDGRGGFARYAPGTTTDNPAERRAAARVLAEALALGDGRTAPAAATGRDASIVLRDLALVQDALAPADQEIAARVLARPTAAGGDGYLDYAADADVTSDCAVAPVPDSSFCVHWARRTSDAPPLTDSDADGVPNQVETTHQVLDLVHQRIVDRGGYAAPPADGSGPAGYRDRFDVYLGDTGSDPDNAVYGYCVPERALSTFRATSYCALDDDFSTSQFPGSPLGNLQVTTAHEFFHAVQFAIDYREDGYFMENSSTWVEDEIFDAVDDNRHYLRRSALARPADPLDEQANWYGNWIWLRFLSETFPADGGTGLPLVVKQAWDRTDDSRSAFSVQALARAVAAQGGSFPELVADFARVNRAPAGFYEEGAAYEAAGNVAPAARTVSLSAPVSGSVVVDHLSSATVAVLPASTLAPGTALRVRIDAPSLPSELQVEVTRRLSDGSVVVRDLTLNQDGNGKARVPFATGDTASVDVTLVNAGRDYRCDTGGPWACNGFSRDDDRRFAYTLRPIAP